MSNIEGFGPAILICIGHVTARSIIEAYMKLDEVTDQGHSVSISTTSYQGLEALSCMSAA